MKKTIALLTGALLLALFAGSAQAHSRSWYGFSSQQHHHHYACGHYYYQHRQNVSYVHSEPGFIW